MRKNTCVATDRMLYPAQLKPGDSVLDMTCGTGEPAIPAAQRVGPTGKVIAIDWIVDMVTFAREKAHTMGVTNIEFRVADGEALDIAPASVDAVTIR